MTTPELNIDEQLACYKLLLEGKFEEVEYRFDTWDHWETVVPNMAARFPSGPHISSEFFLRRKPTHKPPTYRPWKDASEVEFEALFRSKADHRDRHWDFIMTYYESANTFYLKFYSIVFYDIHAAELLENFEHSLDHGQTWKPCGVLVEEKV